MPKHRNLQLERQIHELRAQGMGVRAISRALHVSASGVSRNLNREVNRSILEALAQRLESVESALQIAHEALQALTHCLNQGFATPVVKARLTDNLKSWPAEYRSP